jgi:hypothetical protein
MEHFDHPAWLSGFVFWASRTGTGHVEHNTVTCDGTEASGELRGVTGQVVVQALKRQCFVLLVV